MNTARAGICDNENSTESHARRENGVGAGGSVDDGRADDRCAGGNIDGSGDSEALPNDVYFLNAPDNASALIGLTGHASLLLASNSTGYELYNFSSVDNRSPFANGAIAQTVDEIHSFDSFEASCKADNFKGIRITNGRKEWREPYKRAIKMRVAAAQFDKIRDFALAVKEHPPKFNFFTGYNCMGFCRNALKRGDVCFEDARGNEMLSAFPNSVYDNAVRARNVESFEKINFRE